MWYIMFKSVQLQYTAWHGMFCLHCCCCCSALFCFKTVNQGCLFLLTVLLTSLGPPSSTQCQQVFPCCTVYLAWLVLGARTGFRCLSPFKIGKKHFFGTISLSLFVMKSVSKTYSFNLFVTKSSNLHFCGSYFQFLPWNWVFWNYMETKLLKRFILKTFRSQITCFKQMCVFVDEKSQIVQLGSLDQYEVFFFFVD